LSGRARITAILSALAVIGGSGWAAASKAEDERAFDLAAIAVATEAMPTVTDNAFDVGHLSGDRINAEVTAGADTNCDGCSSTAASVGVVYVNRSGEAGADNLATAATSTCTDCGTVALSVQVVVLRHANTIVANNRSLAVNAACESCTSTAAAYQFVVVAPGNQQLRPKDIAELRAWAQGQLAAMTNGSGRMRSMAQSVPPEVEKTLRAGLGSVTSVRAKVDVKRG
jgi:hypothetical protein